MGLTPEEHGELNHIWMNPPEGRRQRYAELRIKYTNDSEALQWIDMYDPESTYHGHFEVIRNAVFRGGNKEAVRRELSWLHEHYPCLWREGKEFDEIFKD